MPLIQGFHISPLIPVDLRYQRTDKPTDEDLEYFRRMKKEGPIVPPPFSWRTQLRAILTKVTCDFFGLKGDDVSCVFPHDPSVPTNPPPIAALSVSFLYREPERTPERVKEYRLALGKACKEFLDRLRGTRDARVEVKTELCDPEDVDTF